MASSFNVSSAGGYEQLMGRWSKRLAPPFVDFAGLSDNERVLDVGCGNGSLTFFLPQAAKVKEIVAIDYSPVFVEDIVRANTDPRISVRQADAMALPFENGSFDRALSLLVLHFVSDPDKAISEMRRVVRPGGVVAAAVWDHMGGMPGMRMLLDTAAMLDDDSHDFRRNYCFRPMTGPDEMKNSFVAQGLASVEQTLLTIRMDYQSFDDYWMPFTGGDGPLGQYVAGLEAGLRERLKTAVRGAYEAGRPDGPRSFASVAWACRGVVPG
ncbi:class I SAM-dependent methyltransferase [Rhizobium sp. S152]|uniref:class I SAM-dependent methyltransferase n=1 Tax=Rhizobium sp. S152 TaxID=3055038 RepID=UPI0025A94BEF|nr:class I SAM-dependent methyltransferase [Rhizobium sp. S152]MDM9624298.1 class I SAM-dependent methyltransferase [Rhizobium sp. S152]